MLWKVLLCDDEGVIVKGLRRLIDWEALGVEVAGEATDGEMAAALIEQLRPDLVVSDIRMPKLSGLDVMAAVQSGEYAPKFIFISGYGEFEYAQRALAGGAVDYLLKPFHDGDLEQAVLALRQRMEQEHTGAAAQTDGGGLLRVRAGNKSRYVLEAMDYIGAHYNDPNISIAAIAQHLGLSEGHLSHTFKRETDYTLLNYLTRYRVHKAMELLRDCRAKVYEVAEQVGYKDITYFSATFKKLTGMSPSEYQDTSR